MKVDARAAAAYGDNQRFAHVIIKEFPLLVVHYPILFSKDANTGEFHCGAMLGFDEGENLFLPEWRDLEYYRPLGLQRVPFYANGSDVAIDLDHPRVGVAEGTALFTEIGQPSRYLQRIIWAFQDLSTGIEGTRHFIARLLELKLIEPISVEAEFDDGTTRDCYGLYTINQDVLGALCRSNRDRTFPARLSAADSSDDRLAQTVPGAGPKKERPYSEGHGRPRRRTRIGRQLTPAMSGAPTEIAGRDLTRERFERQVVAACHPVVLRGLVEEWPVVRAAKDSPRALMSYLAPFDAGARIEVFFGDPAITGKYYYGESLQGFNFERRVMAFREALEAILTAIDAPGGQSVYAGSAPCRECLPGFATGNVLPLLAPDTSPRIWLGTASNVSSHYDTFDNLACVIAGRRRFTLYSPELISRLYIGPIDRTMAGPPVSLAASSAPDDQRFPLFRKVRDQALICELEPGDALYLPKLWWHQVESLAAFNGLVNYWWDAFAVGPDAPYTSMLLAMITIAERPAEERQAWRAFFEHYVFRGQGHPLAHLPAAEHGLLGPLRPDNYANIRARIMQLLRLKG